MKKSYSVMIVIFVISIVILLLLNYKSVDISLKSECFLAKDLEIEVYSKIKLSDLVSCTNGTLKEDFDIYTNSLGKKEIFFEYYDSFKVLNSGNFSIEIKDKTTPYIGLGKSYTYVIGKKFDMSNSVFCGDNYSKNPVCEIVGTYNLKKVGEYPLIYRATDENGNINEKEFTLKVVDKSPSYTASTISFADIKKRLPSNASLMIDVSKWQQDIDWKKVSENDIKYAMIRLGTQIDVGKGSVIDAYFDKNIKEARANGIKVGVYYFSYARSINDALEQAKFVTDTLKNYEIDLPVTFDYECWSIFNYFDLSIHELNEIADAFLNEVKEAGYKPLLYGSKNYIENVWTFLDYDIWLAHYTDNTSYTGPKIMWQFTSEGEIPGVRNHADVNFYYNK